MLGDGSLLALAPVVEKRRRTANKPHAAATASVLQTRRPQTVLHSRELESNKRSHSCIKSIIAEDVVLVFVTSKNNMFIYRVLSLVPPRCSAPVPGRLSTTPLRLFRDSFVDEVARIHEADRKHLRERSCTPLPRLRQRNSTRHATLSMIFGR